MSITSTTKPWNPEMLEKDRGSVTTLLSDPRGTPMIGGSHQGRHEDFGVPEGTVEAGSKNNLVDEASQTNRDTDPKGNLDGNDGDEIVYPGPLKLSILVIGIALSVFLISLDRTIITTVSISSLLAAQYTDAE